MKKIKQIIKSRKVMMGSIELEQPIPNPEVKQISPFILIHHGGPKEHPPGRRGMSVGSHPHRGFEPVSFIFSGEVEHRDSLGNKSVIQEGGVQWITSGKGILHSEGASPDFRKKGGTFEMIQLWVNLPAKLKMIDPSYQGFNKQDIPVFEGKNAKVNVISGKSHGLEGPIDSLTDIMALTIDMDVNGEVDIEIPEGKNVIMYQLSGKTLVNETAIKGKQLVVFEQEGKRVKINSLEPTKTLFLAGDPIDEPLATYGPFVMNTQEELNDAITDFQKGKMGVLND
mgnify:CR=1 FL=1